MITLRNSTRVLLVATMTALLVAGCVKHAPPAPRVQATPTPRPVDEGVDAAAEKMKRKTGEAAAAINDYLKESQPRLRDKFQKFGDKFARDKDSWRQKLLQKKQELEPQIEALKKKAADLDPKARAEIDKQKTNLQMEADNADQKLNELEAATADGWKAFKDRLKADDAANVPPTPSASPGGTP